MTAHALVLIEAERSAMSRLGPQLARIDGVAQVHSVTGEWDFVAVVQVDEHAKLGDVITSGIQALDGVARTQTLVALDTHDGTGSPA